MKHYTAVSLTVLEQLLRVLVGIVIVGLVARTLGIEKFGLFQYTIAIVGFFSSLTLIYGNELLLPKLMKENIKDNKIELIENVFFIRIITGFFSYILLLFYIFFFQKASFDIVKYMGISIIFFEGFSVAVSLMQSEGDFFTRSIYGIIGVILKFIVVLILYLKNISEPSLYAMAWIVDSIFIVILLSKYLKRRQIYVLKFKHLSFDRYKQLRVEILNGLWVWLSLIGMFLYLKLDRFIGVYLLDTLEFGFYSAAAQLMDNLYAIVTVISPYVAYKIYKRGSSHSLKPKPIINTFLILLLFSTLISVFSSLIIKVIFGEKYTETGHVLSILIFQIILFCFVILSNIRYIWDECYKIVAFRWILAIVVWLVVSSLSALNKYSIIYANYIGLLTILLFDIIAMNFLNKGDVK